VGATSERVVVITGASSGIGRETTRLFAAQGAAVVLAARVEPALHATAGEGSSRPAGQRWSCPPTWRYGRRCSTSRRRPATASGGSTCGSTTPRCPATASFIPCRSRRSTGSSTWTCAGRCTGSRRSCRSCASRAAGTIIGVSSGLGVRAVPLMIPYCIAKSGVNALYEGLRLEERHAKSGVQVTTILPASIDTSFYDSAASWMGGRPAPIPPVYQPRSVAEAIVFAADHPRRDIYIGAAAQLAIPDRAATKVAADDQLGGVRPAIVRPPPGPLPPRPQAPAPDHPCHRQ